MMFLHAVYKEFRLLGRDLHGLAVLFAICLLNKYPSPRDGLLTRMASSA